MGMTGLLSESVSCPNLDSENIGLLSEFLAARDSGGSRWSRFVSLTSVSHCSAFMPFFKTLFTINQKQGLE